MDLKLKGLKALVTGGTKGIGLAIAQTLAAEGADVAICARNGAAVEQTVAGLVQLTGGEVKVVCAAVGVAGGPAPPRRTRVVGARMGGRRVIIAHLRALAVGDDLPAW